MWVGLRKTEVTSFEEWHSRAKHCVATQSIIHDLTLPIVIHKFSFLLVTSHLFVTVIKSLYISIACYRRPALRQLNLNFISAHKKNVSIFFVVVAYALEYEQRMLHHKGPVPV